MTDGDQQIRPPEWADNASWCDGYARAMESVAETASAHAQLVGGTLENPDDADDEDEECPDCGRERIHALGEDGLVCPDCDA